MFGIGWAGGIFLMLESFVFLYSRLDHCSEGILLVDPIPVIDLQGRYAGKVRLSGNRKEKETHPSMLKNGGRVQDCL